MTSALTEALAAPLKAVQVMVGAGWSDDPSNDPRPALTRARDTLADVSAASRRSWLHASWAGAGANAAVQFMAATVSAIDDLADRTDQMNSAADAADAAVARAHQRLRDIVEGFEARAAKLEPYVDSPEVVAALRSEAQRALEEAVAVVEELQNELDGHTATLTHPVAPTPVATTPSGFGGAAQMSSTPTGSIPMGPAPSRSPDAGFGDFARLFSPEAAATQPDAAAFGDGVAVRLPDGTTVTAPNAVAASAVRHALTQLGVPYDWGGTTPGVGLDCSGLTQWAYSEAGLNIPRLAQEQDIGAPVVAGNLRPGDLAVWDGHVAMVVGSGQMIEAGDPVRLSPIRTDNAGQGFQGFWRPTA